ncbi:MAG: hypothetical protein J6K32_10380 [Clostridia bacterium]|nr:hypothetical protein [Clostridia bacterium]
MTQEAFRQDDGFIALVAAAFPAILANRLRIVTIIIELVITDTASVVLRIGTESEMGNMGKRSGVRHKGTAFLRICAFKICLLRKGFSSFFFIISYQNFWYFSKRRWKGQGLVGIMQLLYQQHPAQP